MCDHPSFESEVRVTRMFGYTAYVKVRCAVCGEPFVFLNDRLGMLPELPRSSPHRQELRCPIRPLGDDPEGPVARIGPTNPPRPAA